MSKERFNEIFNNIVEIIARPNETFTKEDKRKAIQVIICIEYYLLDYINEHGECEGYEYSLTDYVSEILDSEEWENENQIMDNRVSR